MSLDFEQFFYRIKGINRDVKRAYQAVFNSPEATKRKVSDKILDDLIIKFKFF